MKFGQHEWYIFRPFDCSEGQWFLESMCLECWEFRRHKAWWHASPLVLQHSSYVENDCDWCHLNQIQSSGKIHLNQNGWNMLASRAFQVMYNDEIMKKQGCFRFQTFGKKLNRFHAEIINGEKNRGRHYMTNPKNPFWTANFPKTSQN